MVVMDSFYISELVLELQFYLFNQPMELQLYLK